MLTFGRGVCCLSTSSFELELTELFLLYSDNFMAVLCYVLYKLSHNYAGFLCGAVCDLFINHHVKEKETWMTL